MSKPYRVMTITAYHEPSGGTASVSYDTLDRDSYNQAIEDLADGIVEYYNPVVWTSITLWHGNPTCESECTPVDVQIVLDVVKAVESL